MKAFPKPTFQPPGQVVDPLHKYAVLCARYQGQWILCRHRQRDTWELPGGHVEPGETPLQAARRELYEETGATDADIQIVGSYRLYDYGLLCFAEVKTLSAIPEDSEIAEIRLFESLPANLTYAGIHEQLHKWVQGWLNLQSGAGELWDIYDAERNLTGRTHRRGMFLSPGDYHLVVHVWIMDCQGRFLLTKRSPNKGFPNLWEAPGGSALAGDDSLTAAIREIREETGLTLPPENGKIVHQYSGMDHHVDVWLFRQNVELSQVRLLEGETCDKMLATGQQVLAMHTQGTLVPFSYLTELFTKTL